jgi:hypothetical protein
MGVSRFQKKIVSGLVAVLALLLSLVPMVSYSLPGLGISISLVNDGPTDAERSGSLWVGVEQGQSVNRTMNIRSLSDDTTQSLEFELYDIIRTDGEKVTDYAQPSKLTPWLVVSPDSPEVEPGETISVTLTFSAPEDADDAAFDAVLRVLASGVAVEDTSEDEGTKAIVKTKLAIEANLWLGVGDALTLEPNFEIESVDGALIDGRKFIRIFIKNNGLVTIEPTGRFQLSDPAFVERVFEPVDFESKEILSSQLGFVDVPVPDDVVDGIYRSFVTAQSGSVRKTQLFEGQIVFDDPNALSISDLAIRIGIFIIAALGLVLGVRLLRAKPKKPSETQSGDAASSEDAVERLRQTVERLEAQLVEINNGSVATKPKTPATSARSRVATKPAAAINKAPSQPAVKAAVSKKPPGTKPAPETPATTKAAGKRTTLDKSPGQRPPVAKESKTKVSPVPKGALAKKRPSPKKD